MSARITAYDQAFFQATHNYDATPKDGYVQVKMDGKVYKVVPNGEQPRIGRPVNYQLGQTYLLAWTISLIILPPALLFLMVQETSLL